MIDLDIIAAGISGIIITLSNLSKTITNPYLSMIITVLILAGMIVAFYIKKQQKKEAFEKQIIDAQKSIGRVSIDLAKDMVDNTARMGKTKQSDLDRLGELISVDSGKLEMVSSLSFGLVKEKETNMTEVQHVGIEQLSKLIDEVMQTAIAGIEIAKHGKELSAELKDLEASEYIQLGSELVVKHIPAILAALKAE